MALVTITGEPGCRAEDAARRVAARIGFELLLEARLDQMVAEEFGGLAALPDRLYPAGLTAILARLACQHHTVVCATGVESLVRQFPGTMRVNLTASDKFQAGVLMLDRRLERPAAQALLKKLRLERRERRRRQFGRREALAEDFDLTLNSETVDADQVAELVERAAEWRALRAQGLMMPVQEASIQFQARLKLAKHGITPAGTAALASRRQFVNASEQIFANLLDFYRITWEYEPRSFPVQWDRDGRVLESFSPDFYLPELDLYIEITTMKQANVTRKNRKVKLLKTIYPQVNIQVFYQKDFQNLVFKYGLASAAASQPVNA
jgi:hypothetical protein